MDLNGKTLFAAQCFHADEPGRITILVPLHFQSASALIFEPAAARYLDIGSEITVGAHKVLVFA